FAQAPRKLGVNQHKNTRDNYVKEPSPQPTAVRDLRNRLQCRKVADLSLEHLSPSLAPACSEKSS
ncbi:hypothetical protein, partial [Pseudomonas fluorescens]|uniref:hypothetical protein n=1 Tax=Pseudomonas fluorescens TaxID=294 RepID=UPI003820570A